MKKLFASLGLMFALLSPNLVLAEDPAAMPAAEAVVVEAAPMAEAAAPAEVAPPKRHLPRQRAAPVPDKGDTAWMLISTILVLLMTIPGLALFYGGLVRAKNMLSVLTQVFTVFARSAILWVDLRLQPGLHRRWQHNSFIGGLSKIFLAGVDTDSLVETFSNGVVIPELVFVAFQMTFACITTALVLGGVAERVKFSAVLFCSRCSGRSSSTTRWRTWCGGGAARSAYRRSLAALPDLGQGALDFAGGTVVHINSGVAASGRRAAARQTHRLSASEPMPPHNLTFTMIGAGLLWVGWFGFNAGSNLEATPTGARADQHLARHRRRRAHLDAPEWLHKRQA